MNKYIFSLIALLSTQAFANPVHDAVHDFDKLQELFVIDPDATHEECLASDTQLEEYLFNSSYNGLTPLDLAVYQDTPESVEQVVELLLEEGATSNGWPLIMWALVKHENKALAKMLIEDEDHLSINTPNSSGETPLSWAASNDEDDLVKLLLNNGANGYEVLIRSMGWNIEESSYEQNRKDSWEMKGYSYKESDVVTTEEQQLENNKKTKLDNKLRVIESLLKNGVNANGPNETRVSMKPLPLAASLAMESRWYIKGQQAFYLQVIKLLFKYNAQVTQDMGYNVIKNEKYLRSL